jgi:hypothetical protein
LPTSRSKEYTLEMRSKSVLVADKFKWKILMVEDPDGNPIELFELARATL